MSTRFVKYMLLIAVLVGLVQLMRAEAAIGSRAIASPGAEWTYRRVISINNPGVALSDYQVKITLNSANFDFSHAQPGGQDVRVLDTDDVTPLSYWIENYDAAAQTATLWVKVPSLPANTSRTIYLYYGNPTAPATSNGTATFDFFDNFELTAAGYYTLTAPTTTLSGSAQAWETSAIHTFSVVPLNRGGYTYWGYYGLQAGSGNIGLAFSNDLVTWSKYTGNPLFPASEDARWASVVTQTGTLYMVYNKSYVNNPSIALVTSTDGLHFSSPTTLVPDMNYMRIGNPDLFYNPNDNLFYLYWYVQDTTVTPNTYTIYVRSAATAAGLANAPTTTLLTSTTTLAAPDMMFANGTYFLSTETLEGGIWKTRILAGSTPIGPFTPLPDNPILSNGEACFFQHIFGSAMHAWYCKLTGSTWTLEHRTADLAGGRPQVPYLDPHKWTPGGNETWSVQSTTQQNGAPGFVAQLVGDPNRSGPQILASTFSGTDYVLEGSGQLINGRVWGLGARVTNQDNLYSVNLYEDLDETNNLYLYRWLNNASLTLNRTAAGTINSNTWYKLGLTVHGSSLEVYLNDLLRLSAGDAQFASGKVALAGEAATTARFNDIRVRKYAATDPIATVGSEQAQGTPMPTLTPSITLTPTITPTPSITPTSTPTPTSSATPLPSATPTDTPIPPTPTSTPTLTPSPVPGSLNDGLLDYWQMDETAGDFLGAANGKIFTVSGAVTNAGGKVYSTARQFPGVGTLGVGIRDNNDVRFGDTDVTFAFWWYQYTQPLGSGNNLYHYIWHQDDYYGGYTFGLNRGDQLFVQSGSGNNQFDTLHSSVISTPTNTWHFAIVWYDSTARQLHLRIDNGQDQSTSASPHAMGEFPARIGASYTNDNVMDGRIGPVAVWNRLLTTSEMSQLWNTGNGLAYPFALSGISTPTMTPTATPTNTPTPTSTPTFTATPTNTPTPTATATPANTGLLNPGSNAALAGGDNNGFETNPTNAYSSNNVLAVDNNSGTTTRSSCTSTGKDRHAFYTYNVSLPANATILGIEVRADARVDSVSGSPRMCIQLSWDGGVTWTSAKTTPTLGTNLSTNLVGSPTDTWGRTWTINNLSNANLRVRITNVATSNARDFSLDWLAVRITYRP